MSSSSSSSSGAKKRDASALATPEETEHDLPDKAERTAAVNARPRAEVAGPARLECPICMSDKSMLGVSSAACAVPRTEALRLTAVQQDGYALRFVPEPFRTEALCLAAVQQYEDALQHVPGRSKPRRSAWPLCNKMDAR